jgi:hypothetical protein
MEKARKGPTAVRREMDFPTEWTMVDDGANLREEPQLAVEKNAKVDSGEEIEDKKTPLAAHACASL